MLVVSHDRRLLETLCDRLWVVDRGLAAPFDGGYRAWRTALAEGWTVEGAVAAEAQRLHGGRGGAGAGGRPGGSLAQAGPAAPRAPSPADRRATAVAPRATTGDGRTRPAARSRPVARPKLSKDAYRSQKAIVDADLARLGLRKSHLELALANPSVAANFVELRRVTSELADVEQALAAAEEAWLELEERAP